MLSKVILSLTLSDPEDGVFLLGRGIQLAARSEERGAQLRAQQVPGRRVFDEKKGAQRVDLRPLQDDLAEQGYVLTGVHLLHRPDKGDKYYLRFTYEPNGTAFVIPDSAKEAIDAHLADMWLYTHVFVNPDNTATVNPSIPRPMQGNHNALRLRADNAFETESRSA